MQTEESGIDRGGEGFGEIGHTNLFQRLPIKTTTCDTLKAQWYILIASLVNYQPINPDLSQTLHFMNGNLTQRTLRGLSYATLDTDLPMGFLDS